MSLWKIVQRHSYDLLSHKYSVIIILISFTTIIVSIIQFGEVWMVWSQEKYDAVFNSFSDNIKGKSLQNKLCQNIPIDVVYTWVNGSDPILLQQLQEYRIQLVEETSQKCPHTHCLPTHIVTLRQWLPDENIQGLLHSDSKGGNYSHINRIQVAGNNWTLIEFQSVYQAAEVVKHAFQSNITLHHGHWTTDNIPNAYGDINIVIISGLPGELFQETGNNPYKELTNLLQIEIQNLWVYDEKRVVVLKVDSSETVNRIVTKSHNITFYGHVVNVQKAFLIMELPVIGNSKDFSPSRFEDKEELRYSLRSLEQFAPWVRHVYLVTNGQIPYWLDLENPRLTIITHEQIFPDPSHLPTFSSPAIESHLHRIPGVSNRFLYLNDDVMFGKEVWPDDFITHASGQKVYLSWPVPDCSDSCPWSWVADGSCDVSCNISDCSFDGGDCDLSNEDELGLYDENRHLVNYDDDINSYNENPHNHPHDSLNDNLFHDMNFGGDIALEDLSEPGKRMNSLLDILIRKKDNNDKFKRNLMNFTYFITSNYNGTVFDSDHTTPFTYNSTKKTFKVLNNSEINNAVKSSSHLKKSYFKFSRNKTQAIIKNGEKSLKKLSDLRMNNTYKNKPLNEKEEKNSKSTIIDSSTQSFVQELFGINNNSFNEYHVDGWNDTENHVELYPEHAQEDVSFKRGVQFKGNQSRSETLLNPLQNEASIQTINQTGSFLQNHNASTDIHIKNSETYNKQSVKHKTVRNVPYNSKLRKLYEKLNGKFEEPDKLLGKHGPSSPGKNTNLEKQQNSDYDEGWNPMTRKSAEKFSKIGTLKKKQKAVRVYDVHHYGNLPSSGKKPHDTFAESLLYVNRLFNQEFGFEPRKVPAHMPHLIDNYIMEQLQSRFSEQWKLTSSHKVRNANDMQFAFSYFYFLMSSRKTVPLEEIFDMFDTDHSGTWSDREIRTLLTRSYELPLSYSRVVKFENDIINCSNSLPEELSNIHISTPSYERYQDSKLPVVSKILITHCKPVADMLKKKFGKKKKYRYQIEHDKHLDVSFKMLNSNISQLVSHLDDIRRDPKKFICLNDNLDPDREEDNAIARAILQDMYESLFPQPSSFELPPEFRNRFLHIAELQAWRASRNTIRTIVYICLTILITFTLVNFFHVECRWLQRKIFHRSGQHYQLDSASVPCV